MSRVFIPQDPQRRNRVTGDWERAVDLRPAEKFGELVFILQAGRAPPANTVVGTMTSFLDTYCDDDYLLPIGDPSLIAVMSIIASDMNDGFIKMLLWDRASHEYNVSEIWTKGDR